MSEHDELIGVLREILTELRRKNDTTIDGTTEPRRAASDAVETSGEESAAAPATRSTMPPPVDPEQPSHYDVSGPGPQFTDVSTVLVVAKSTAIAQDVASKWIIHSTLVTSSLTIADKAARDEWTKKIRNDPQEFIHIARERKRILFVIGDTEMQPANWRPAFDVIAVVSSGTNGLVYQLIKGRRARV